MKARIEGIIRELSKPEDLYENSKSIEKIEKTIASLKKKFVKNNDESNANFMWCLGGVAHVFSEYFGAFRMIKSGKFYDGWCRLELAEISLIGIRKHLDPILFKKFKLDDVSEKILHWQSLFPYKMFYSPEFVAKEKKCSICGSTMDIRQRCKHIAGELYDGEECHRVLTKVEFVGLSLVENPVQKYSVAFTSGVDGEKIDHYDYMVVKYAAKAIADPFLAWSVTTTKAYHPHGLYSECSPEDPCPCECPEKIPYKDCCLKKEGVIRPHLQFQVTGKFPKGLPPLAFSSDLRHRVN
jgi:hypothetical protein